MTRTFSSSTSPSGEAFACRLAFKAARASKRAANRRPGTLPSILNAHMRFARPVAGETRQRKRQLAEAQPVRDVTVTLNASSAIRAIADHWTTSKIHVATPHIFRNCGGHSTTLIIDPFRRKCSGGRPPTSAQHGHPPAPRPTDDSHHRLFSRAERLRSDTAPPRHEGPRPSRDIRRRHHRDFSRATLINAPLPTRNPFPGLLRADWPDHRERLD